MPEEPKKERRWNRPLGCFALLGVAYLGVGAIILIDEAILETFWFSRNAPPGVEKVATTLYWPVIKLVELLR